MIRFRRLFDVASDEERRQLDEFATLFRAEFPEELAIVDRIVALVENRVARNFGWILLIAEDGLGRVLGFTHWNRKQAAKLLGVSYKTLLQKIRGCGLEPG